MQYRDPGIVENGEMIMPKGISMLEISVQNEPTNLSAASQETSVALTAKSGLVLTIAGYWRPVTSAAVLSRDYDGNLANTFHGLVRLGVDSQYGLAVTGWGTSGWSANSKVPAPVSIALFAPDGSGGLKLATSDFISDPITNGGGSVIVADFNGDGRDDVVFCCP